MNEEDLNNDGKSGTSHIERTHTLIFGRLTREQKNAVLVDQNTSLLIVAGPGTGKTATITARILFFLLKGHSPILALTFTRKAANELRNRVSILYSSSVKNLKNNKQDLDRESETLFGVNRETPSLFLSNSGIFVGTIHSFCWKILRQYGSYLGLPKEMSILDKDYSIKLLKLCITEMTKKMPSLSSQISNIFSFSLDSIDTDEVNRDDYDEDSDDENGEEGISAVSESNISSRGSKTCELNQNDELKLGSCIKNSELERLLKVIKILKYKKFLNNNLECSIDDVNGNFELLSLYLLYTKRMTENKPYLVDYTDLITLVLRLLENNKHVRQKIQLSYPYVFCDEFQDTSKLQLRILELLAKRDADSNKDFVFNGVSLKNEEGKDEPLAGGITVVGDDDQAIYSWRGVETGVFRQFSEIFKDNFKATFLTENFRSTGSIVSVSTNLIHNNKLRMEKSLKTNNGVGIEPKVSFFSRISDEILWMARTIILLKIKYNYSWSDFAVLTRTNDTLFYLEKLFNEYSFIENSVSENSNTQNKTNDTKHEKKCWKSMIPSDLVDVDNLELKSFTDSKAVIPTDNTSRNNTKNTRDLLNKTEILDILSYCRLLVDETADDCFLRVCNRPKRGIGENALKIIELNGAEGISLIRKSTQPLNGINEITSKRLNLDFERSNSLYRPIIHVCRKLLNGGTVIDASIDSKTFKKSVNSIRSFIEVLDKLKEFISERRTVPEIIKEILEQTGYLDPVRSSVNPSKRKKESNKEDRHSIKNIDLNTNEKIGSVIDSISRLIKCSEPYVPNSQQPTGLECLICFLKDASNGLLEQKKQNKVSLSTIHKAKGLEWKVVFIPRFVDNIFPLLKENEGVANEVSGKVNIEEERRIVYVAFTRAKERLFITAPLNLGKVSPFIQEANIKLDAKFALPPVKEQIKQVPKTIKGFNWK
ncbi:helicase [Cryptosporidium ryanae]|uniref:helicase n=1 Tax=Cryptosporidium ryanae TaxID=515981 RepID=UPI00351A5952|nr:helicase [Cryptosporidium ryanae]